MKNLKGKFYAVFAIAMLTVVVTAMTGFNFLATGGVLTALSFLPSGEVGVALIGLNKEIWTTDLMEGFYEDDSFLSEMVDMSAFVMNDIINLAEAGVNPDVLVNNTTYPIPFAQRSDVPLALTLDTYDTENTEIKSIETAELSYDKRTSVINGHKQSLRDVFKEKAVHNIAPTTDTILTPIVLATGGDNGDGLKRLTFKDVISLRTRFNKAKIPAQGRILILSSQHEEDLSIENVTLYNQVTDKGVMYGFKLYFLSDDSMPKYNKTTGVKKAYGAAAAPSTDSSASVAFYNKEVMKAQGSVDMFSREKDPELRSDMIGFQMRGLSIPIRNKGIASIYSPAV